MSANVQLLTFLYYIFFWLFFVAVSFIWYAQSMILLKAAWVDVHYKRIII